MDWITDEHGLIEDQGGPSNLMAYEARPEFCIQHTKEEYRRLHEMLNPHHFVHGGFRTTIPHLAGVLLKADFDPDEIIKRLIEGTKTCSRIGYSYVKKEQVLVLQVALENVPLFMGSNWNEYEEEHIKTLDTILRWRLTYS